MQSTQATTIDQWMFRIAGTFILLSLLLTWAFSPWWLAFTAFVGLNMLQASFTGFCPLAMILGKLGIAPGSAFCQPRSS